MPAFEEPEEPSTAGRRSMMFKAFTGKDKVDVTGTSTDTIGMLRSLKTRPNGTIDTRAVAKTLNVSQRTVQRWVKGQQHPRKDNLKRLKDRSRQVASTKKGRANAIKTASSTLKMRRGAKLTVTGKQGVPGSNVLGHSYLRHRTAGFNLTPQQAEDLMDAYVRLGDQGMKGHFAKLFSSSYGAGEWEIASITNLRFDPL